MNKFTWKFTIILVLLTAIVGCNQAPAAETAVSQTSQPAASTTPSEPSAEKEVTVKESVSSPSAIEVDEAKVEELLSQFNGQKAEKVVTLSVSITELLNALDIVPVGVPTSSSKLPTAFDQVPRIGSSHSPDLEQIAKLQPDFVLGPASIKENLNKSFSSTSLQTAYLPADSLEELKLSTIALGRLFNQESKAEAFIQKFMEEEQAVLDSIKDKEAPSVMLLFGSVEALMLMNENTYVGSLAQKLGASNVVTEVLQSKETYVPLDMESVVTANPDVILLVAHGDPDAVAKKFEEDTKKNGAWEKLDAFKNNKLIALDYSLYGIASIVKAPEAYKDLVKILYN